VSRGDAATSDRSGEVLLALLAAAYFFAFYDRQLMVVVGEMVKHEFTLSDKELSLLTGATFVLIYGTGGIVTGWLGDRVSRKTIMVWALLTWSAITTLTGFSQSFLQLALARVGLGVGEAATVPVGISAIADRYSPARRPMALAIFYAAGPLGILACFLAGAWLATRYGWRLAFFVAGPPGVLLAALIALFLREPLREASAEVGAAKGGGLSYFRLVWDNRPLRWLLIAGALAGFISVGMLQWLPIFFLRSHHLTLSQLARYFGPVLTLGMISGLLLGGWIGNRVAARSIAALTRVPILIMIGVVPVYLLVFWLSSLAAAFAATLLGTTLSVLYAPSYNAAWQAICDPRARGTAAGISAFATMMIGGSACTYFIGALSDWLKPMLGAESLRYALSAAMSFCLIAAALFAYSSRLTNEHMQAVLTAHGKAAVEAVN